TNISEVSKYKSPDKNFVFGLSKAARTIRDYPEDITTLYYNGKLRELDGIDDIAYGFIQEYFESGKIKAYEELRSAYSEELVRLVRMSGLGAKLVFGIYDRLGIKNIIDLKNLLENRDIYRKDRFLTIDKGKGKDEGKGKGLIVVSGFHMKRLRETLSYFERTRSYFPGWYIGNFIDKVEHVLKSIPEIEDFRFVGSLRRKKLFVSDIDILILPSFNVSQYSLEKSIDLLKRISLLDFIKTKGLVELKYKNKTVGSRFRTIFGVDMEFIISGHKTWVLDLFYTTGTKAHVKKIENIAREKGCFKDGRISLNSVNSELIEPRKLNSLVYSFKDFEDKIIYDLLGLQYIPPELRENQGEVELSKKSLLPNLVELEDIKGDLHVHSRWSDATMDFDDILEKAEEYNYEYVAISDHSKSNVYGNGLDERRLLEKIRYVDEYNKSNSGKKSSSIRSIRNVRILSGSEVEIRENGKLDYKEEILEKLDIAIGSMHSGFASSSRENTLRAISGLRHKRIDFLAHPTGVVFGNRAPMFIDLERLVEEASENNKALEINSYFLRLDLDEKGVRKAKEKGVKLVINTDSHRLNNIDMIVLGVAIARRAGLEKDDILNCMCLRELMKWRSER
ncbi:MAG: PHP domain-containing protein, partial [Actinobacteria bacterium]|nr:PHP domain-containing protein [Actinomycetota bacterium]